MSNEILAYGITDAAIAELRLRFSEIPDASTDEGYEKIKADLKILNPYVSKVEKKRKELKADSLTRGRLIDSEAKRITSLLLEINGPLKDAKKNRDDAIEKEKQAAIDKAAKDLARFEENLNEINDLVNGLLGAESSVIKKRIDKANSISVGPDNFGHFENKAIESMDVATQSLSAALTERLVYEKTVTEQAEQAKILAEQQAEMDKQQAEIDAEKEKQDLEKRDEEIKKEAAAQAKIDAENAAQKKIDDARAAEEKTKADAEKRIAESAKAVKEAEQRAAETIAKARREAVEAEEKLKADAQKREADIVHKKRVNNGAVNCLVAAGLSEAAAKECITAIAQKKIKNVVISY